MRVESGQLHTGGAREVGRVDLRGLRNHPSPPDELELGRDSIWGRLRLPFLPAEQRALLQCRGWTGDQRKLPPVVSPHLVLHEHRNQLSLPRPGLYPANPVRRSDSALV